MIAVLVAFLLGALFAIGLGIGSMTLPAKIIGFLDVTGAWDPSLVLVLGGAVVTYAVMYRMAIGRGRPLFADAYVLPGQNRIDVPLVAGAAIFGIGWGMSGFCPGPAIVALVTGKTEVLSFVAAMIVGMWLHDGIAAWRQREASAAANLPVTGSADG
ncbi:MAG TPA: DUF6691 family protein [bacterium]